MEFTVKGISFSKEDLETISLDELVVNSISYSHLFVFVKDKPYLMLRAGDLITEEFIEKYQSKGLASFFSKSIVNTETYNQFKDRLRKIKTLPKKLKKEQLPLLFNEFSNAYWQESEKSYLSFAMACYDIFYNLPSECITSLQNKSQILYARSLIISSLSVMTALIDNIMDEKYLRDIYNTAFIMDYGLIRNGDFNYLLSKACEYERNHPGTGLSWLKSHPQNTYEADVFYQHPKTSYLEAKRYEESFHYPELLNVITYHHEKTDGSGFPQGFSFSGLAHNEVMIMMADYLVPFHEYFFKEGDGFSVIGAQFKKLEEIEDIHLVPVSYFIAKWKQVMDWSLNSQIEKDNEEESSEQVLEVNEVEKDEVDDIVGSIESNKEITTGEVA